MKQLRAQRGWTIIEVLVAIALIGVAAAIAIPQFNGVKNGADNGEARGALQSAFESAQEYYQGEDNPYGNMTFAGFTAAVAEGIDPAFDWVDGATVDPANFNQIAIRQATSAPDPDNEVLVLCNASEEYTYCVTQADVTAGSGQQSSLRWGAATGADVAAAAGRLNNTSCNTKPELAERLADSGSCGGTGGSGPPLYHPVE